MSLFTHEQLYNENNILRKKSLFWELSYSEPEHCIMTLKPEDFKGYKSLYKLFMSLTEDDPTEYTFALTVFGSWRTWQKLQTQPKFAVHLKEWREEVQLRIKSKAIVAIAKEAPQNYQAAKYLLENNMLTKDGFNSYHTNEKPQKTSKATKSKALDSIEEEEARVLQLHNDNNRG